jgi:transcriptional regulator with XRE-family HTH domain
MAWIIDRPMFQRQWVSQFLQRGMTWVTVSNQAMTTIGSRVRALRKRRGYTQAGLAQLVGITQGSLSLIETNQTEMPAGETLGGLCRALRTTPDFLIAGIGDSGSIDAAIMEHELVFLWRDLPAPGRQMVLDAAHSAKRALAAKTEPAK